MQYTTQMDAARKGIITKEMESAAKKEQMDVRELMALMAKGQVIIPCNKKHTSLEPNAIGSMLRTKINVNLGISRDCKDMDMEIEKVNNAVKMGAESIMDLSSYGDTRTFRRRLTKECPAIIGTVPIYDAVVSVSYTHLDVYKRQDKGGCSSGCSTCLPPGGRGRFPGTCQCCSHTAEILKRLDFQFQSTP